MYSQPFIFYQFSQSCKSQKFLELAPDDYNADKNIKQFCLSVEFCREVTDIQMPHVASVILPEMYKIFIHAEVCMSRDGFYLMSFKHTQSVILWITPKQ